MPASSSSSFDASGKHAPSTLAAANRPAMPIPEAVMRRPGSTEIDHADPINALIKYKDTTTNVPRFHSKPLMEPPTDVLSAQMCSINCKNDDVWSNDVPIRHPCPLESKRPGTKAPNAVNVRAPGPTKGFNTLPSNVIQ
mmetsp:Transcript_23166/g.37757  ORF Transcript_23166/g.37757 Transcript_23166/m.37757 type:complete len:139 (-) Transcript_23166:419-835(-)